MSVWAECLVSIRFDLDVGPKVEYVTPPGALNDAGKQHLLRVAFPDCNPDCGHDFIFFFTTSDCTAVAGEIQSATVAVPSHGSTVSKIHGAAYYRQKRDPNVPRGYVQQVVVLLSRVPYLVAHELILRVVVPRFAQCCALSPDTEAVPVASALSPVPKTFFALDMAYNPHHYTQSQVLDEAVQEIANWPTPHPRVRYDVMLLHQPLAFTTPSRVLRSFARGQQNAVHRPQMVLDDRVRLLDRDVMDATDSTLCSAFMAVPLFGVLGGVLHHLTRLWELVMCHEPICIIGNTPSTASAAAVAVASLVLPITFNGVLRAYFTVQDESFGRFTRMGKALPFPPDESLIVAGTNPFLIRSFEGWPTLLAVSDHYANSTGSFQGVGGTAPTVGSPLSTTTASAAGAATPSPPLGFREASQRPEHVDPQTSPGAGPALAGLRTPVTLPASAITTSSSSVRAEEDRLTYSLVTGSELDSGADDPDVAQAEADTAAMLGLPYGCKLPSLPPPAASATTRPMEEASANVSATSRVEVPAFVSVGPTELPTEVGDNPLHNGCVAAPSLLLPQATDAVIEASPVQIGAADTVCPASPAPPRPGAFSASTSTTGSLSASPAHREATTITPLPPPLSPVYNSSTCSRTTTASTAAQPGSPVFSQADFSALVASRRIAGQSSIAKSNPSGSRSKLQHHLRNYFDSSYPFLLDHEAQTSALYRRLEAISKMDEGAQRTSSVLLSEQFAGPSATNSAVGAHRTTSPSPQAQASPQGTGTDANGGTVETVTDHSQFLVADDVVRKFFISLTREFLSPVTTWFALTTASLNAFQLCDRSIADVLLSGDSFLQYFLSHHREVAPAMVRRHHSYKSYKVMYERFANGKLFIEYMRQLVQERLRTEMSFFQVEEWAARFPSDAERVDMFINLYTVVKRELELCIDPDVILVTTATAVLASMAVFISEPLREQFMMKIGDLRL